MGATMHKESVSARVNSLFEKGEEGGKTVRVYDTGPSRCAMVEEPEVEIRGGCGATIRRVHPMIHTMHGVSIGKGYSRCGYVVVVSLYPPI
jgi:hypothetical protein